MFWKVKTQSAKICLNFNFWGEGVFWKVKTQSAKICLNFNFREWGVLESQNPKCQDLPKFQIVGLRGVFWKVNKICLNFNLLGGGGGGCSGKSKPKVPRSA